MNNFLAKLKPDSRINVGVSVSPHVGLEMIVVDTVQNKVMKYAHRQLMYNPSTREIEDYHEFKQLLRDLYSELRLNPSETNVVLNMPSVFFGHTYLPTVLDDDGVKTALVSEVEQNYLFKKNTPVVSWFEMKENNTAEKRYILYSAMQESVVESIRGIFAELGANLIAVENSYSSLLKTLEYSEVAKDFVLSHTAWNILYVAQNSYAVFSMVDNAIVEYFEEPLAVKSFNEDEVYVAIAQAASMALSKYPTDKLLIISESNDVSAEILAIQMKQPGDVIFLECNQYSKQPILDVDFEVLPHYVKAITPEVIGAGIYKNREFGLKFNFIADSDAKPLETINVFGLELTKEQLMIYTVLLGVAIVAVCFFVSILVGGYASNLASKSSALEQEITSSQAQLETLRKSSGVIDIYAAAKDIDKRMISKVSYFDSIGFDIPAKVWLTLFYADSTGAYGIKGETTSVDEVYVFFRNIKSRVSDSDLILSKLSVDDQGGAVDIEKATDATYTFELTNNRFGSVKVSDPNEVISGNKGADGNKGSVSVPNLPNLPQ